MVTFKATFGASDGLVVTFVWEGASPQHLAIHLAVLAMALHGDWESAGIEGEAPQLTATFPESGKAGLKWAWSGLAYPKEQLGMLGHCLLARAYEMWGAELPRKPSPGVPIPVPRTFHPDLFGRS